MAYIFIILLIVLGEYNIKNYMEEHLKLGERKEILKGRIILRKYYNTGAFLNFLEEKKKLVTILSSACLGMILLLFAFVLPKKGSKLFKLGLSLIIGGAASNVADRIHRGYVVDYFSINCKKLKSIIFNLADIAIFIGTAMILLSTVFPAKIKGCTDKPTE